MRKENFSKATATTTSPVENNQPTYVIRKLMVFFDGFVKWTDSGTQGSDLDDLGWIPGQKIVRNLKIHTKIPSPDLQKSEINESPSEFQ